MWVHRFKVRGSGSFPMDMLRYDACYPLSSEDAAKLSNTTGVWEIRLSHYDIIKTWTPCVNRWRSFICEVVEIEKPFKI